MYIVVERCADYYFGPEAIIFLNYCDLAIYIIDLKNEIKEKENS